MYQILCNIKSSIRYFLSIKNILLLALVVVFSAYISYSRLQNYIRLNFTVSASDMLSSIYGIFPAEEKAGINVNLLGRFLIMTLPFTIAIYIVSSYINTYVLQHCYFSTIRFKSLLKWFFRHFTVLSVSTILYFFIFNFSLYFISGLITTFESNSMYASSILGLTRQSGDMPRLLALFCVLQCSCIIVVVSVQYVLSFLKGSFAGFSTGILLIVISILFSLFTSNNLYFKNIVLQKSILSNSMDISTFIFTLFINIISVVLVLFIGYKLLSKMDLSIKK